MNTCIYCGAKDNLVAQLTITLDDGKKATVDVCETHAEDATIRTAREKYLARKSEIDILMEKARELGLELSPQTTPGGLVLMQKVTAPQPQRAVHTAQVAAIAEDDPEFVDAEVIERRERRQIQSRGGSVGGSTVESHRSLDLSDITEQLGSDILHGKVKVEAFEKQSGAMVAIPTTKVNGLGTTHINVVQTTDQEMQRRFKDQAERSRSERGWDNMRHLGKEGIELTNCPICKGQLVVRDRGKQIPCPKCHGRGII